MLPWEIKRDIVNPKMSQVNKATIDILSHTTYLYRQRMYLVTVVLWRPVEFFLSLCAGALFAAYVCASS